jgi:hypothetical protein
MSLSTDAHDLPTSKKKRDPMKTFRFVAPLLLLIASAFAQMPAVTTLTTTQNGASQKAIDVTLSAIDENGQHATIVIDNRVIGTGPLGNVTVSSLEFTGSAHGTLAGIIGNPNGTKQPFTSIASYIGFGYTPSGQRFTVYGALPYHAVFNFICQGRGCPTYGWHYSFDAGSIISVQLN